MAQADSLPKRDNTTPSCAVCQRRKVKCNRIYPCAPCQKTGLECTFKPTNQPRQKKQKRSSLDDGSRRTIDEASPATSSSASAPSNAPTTRELPPPAPVNAAAGGRLVSDGGGYRYVNNHLWNAITTQADAGISPSTTATDGSTPGAFQAASRPPRETHSGESMYESGPHSGSTLAMGQYRQYAGAHTPQAPVEHSLPSPRKSFIFRDAQYGRPATTTATGPARPSPSQIIQLWQAYLSNVDPIMKVFHAPTVQQTVLGQIGKTDTPPNEQALLSAIYLLSVLSLSDTECRSLLSEPRDDLLRSYRDMTEDSLSAAGFVTTADIIVLQAFVLYLVALRTLGDTLTVWSLSGLAIRVAGTIGLARDGSLLDLPPFECEMRRRLWWAIVYLDGRTAELVGQDGDLLVQRYDVQQPANLNDSDLFPGMHRLPEPRRVATEMCYVQMRATLASAIRGTIGTVGAGGFWQTIRDYNVPTAEKERMISQLEQQFDEDFLRHCDPTVPLQALTINSTKTFLTKVRLVGNVPSPGGSHAAEHDNGYSENIFSLSMTIMQLQLELWCVESLRKWRWHWQGQFQWYALAELIRQTRLRKPGATTKQAWAVIRRVFDIIIPTLDLSPRKSPLLDAIRSLLHAATNGTERTIGIEKRASASFSPINLSSPATPYLPRFASNSSGSRPHGALLPGMASVVSDLSPYHSGESIAAFDDPALGLDFSAIDWGEFDRLTSELCGQ